MNPSLDDRINSMLRALSHVILPALPEDADLAREQTLLVMGHLQILQVQNDAVPTYEDEEAADFREMAAAIVPIATGDNFTTEASKQLQALLDDTHDNVKSREQAGMFQKAIDNLLVAIRKDGEDHVAKEISATLLPLTTARAGKDRKWFAAMGFDTEFS